MSTSDTAQVSRQRHAPLRSDGKSPELTTSARPAPPLLSLQRLCGNQAVSRLIQRCGPVPCSCSDAQRQPAQAESSVSLPLQRFVEANFPGGGKVDDVLPGEHVVWNFDVGQDRLKQEHRDRFPALVQEIKAAIAANDETKVDLVGEASATGKAAGNAALAERRVAAVKSGLVDAGAPEDRLRTTSVGQSQSRGPGQQVDLARSRAVHIILVPRVPPPKTSGPVRVQPNVQGCKPISMGGVSLDLTASKVQIDEEAGQTGPRAGGKSNPGVTIIAGPGAPSRCGQFSWVQNVQPYREIIFKDGSRNRLTGSGWQLDTSDPFHCDVVGFFLATQDSPGMLMDKRLVGKISSIEARDEFRMFFMFTPVGGQRQTLQFVTWSWVGLAINKDPAMGQGELELDSTSGVNPGSSHGKDSNELPVLSPNVLDALFDADAAGSTLPVSFATQALRVLNVKRSAPTPKPCP